MIDKTLCEKMLEAPFIIKNYINDEPECNYERYLTELINHSGYFMRKTNGKPFKWIESQSQSHGECDAVSECYSLDYKLLATKSSLQGLRETSESITKLGKGSCAFGLGRWPVGEAFEYIRTVAAVRQYSVEDLSRIAEEPYGRIEKEVSIILKSLRAKKNLLLLYPYIILFSEPHTFDEGCDSITEAFNEDLNRISIYRRNEAPDYDTFLCTIYENKLLIYQEKAGNWKLEDSVELSLSKEYMDLYYTYGNGGFNVAFK